MSFGPYVHSNTIMFKRESVLYQVCLCSSSYGRQVELEVIATSATNVWLVCSESGTAVEMHAHALVSWRAAVYGPIECDILYGEGM
jgi:hypothetical protein